MTEMNLNLSNKVAIVTGASKGIGKAIALTLAKEGMRLVLAARSGELLDEVARKCGTECVVLPLDLRMPDAPAKLVDAAIERFGRIDLLVNNAGATKRGDFLKLTDMDWADGYALKMFGAMRCCRAAWPYLVKTRGSIVNIVGIGGRTPSAEFTIGGSVNAALLNLTKALADRGTIDGVRVNAINPGAIVTDRLHIRIRNFAKEHGLDESAAQREMARSMGIARFGQPEEIANAVAFLTSDRASYLHGSIIDIDGGATRTL
ncbi:MAG TPA: SDR family oxidoreductase [Tepidisphaeraceae bacterium]|jgi:3-oxoacyl-[acyl-carrier protein] reductase|nr:SDR family oxidoreductase [Tepidisphaeraceae bacterium]